MDYKIITVNGDDYFLIFDSDMGGSSFVTRGEDTPSAICVGTKNSMAKDIAMDIAHELMELILTVDNKRWNDKYSDDPGGGVLFCFDHTYFRLMIPKFIDAMLKAGVIKLDEPESDKKLLEAARGALRKMQEEGPGCPLPCESRKDPV